MNDPSTSNSGSCNTSGFPSKLLINRKRQEGNPVLKYIRNVPYEWSIDIKPDFECARNCCILYLSIKYHKLHPAYIETRFSSGNNYQIKILLVLINVDEPANLLRDLNMYCYRMRWTLVLSYSVEEAAEYIENFKLAEKRSPEAAISNYQQYRLQRQQKADGVDTAQEPSEAEKNQELFDHAVNFLSKIRTVSQSDAKRLLCTFGNLQSIARTSRMDLEHCPGLGPVKAQYIYDFFRTPFLV